MLLCNLASRLLSRGGSEALGRVVESRAGLSLPIWVEADYLTVGMRVDFALQGCWPSSYNCMGLDA